jgi:diadenosine tetraphosphate (Ap4A) HIT family hydrolase
MRILFPNAKVLKTKLIDIHQDWEVPIPAFFIISLNRKVRTFAEFNDQELWEFIKYLQILRKGMQEILKIEDVYFFQNEDTEHGFHFWVFPRFAWMEKFGIKIQSVRPIMEFAKENLISEEKIKEVEVVAEKMKIYMQNNLI